MARHYTLSASALMVWLLVSMACIPLRLDAQQASENNKPGQEPAHLPEQDVFQQRIELLMEQTDQETDPTGVMEELEMLRRNPLNINTAGPEDLKLFFFLTEIQINNLINHRSRFGLFISLHELQSVEGFDVETIRLLFPFISVGPQSERKTFRLAHILSRGSSQYFLRYQRLLEQQKGYAPISAQELKQNPNARYLGLPFRLYTRYRFTYYNNISIGVTAEKDPGETFFRDSQPRGFDYYSAHFYLHDVGMVKSLALGDFQLQFGQGLTLWSGLTFGKSSQALFIKKNALGVRPYTSVDENNFLRGAAITLKLKTLEITGFYSEKYRDAGVVEFDTIAREALVISSLQQTGLHRTPRELENKNSVKEKFMGSNISWQRNNLTLGMTGYYMALDADYNKNISFYNQFDLSSNTNWNIGFDYSYLFRNFNFFGEAARSQSGGYALLNGIMMSLDPRVGISLLHRKFTPHYQSPLSAAFSENTRVSNESGLYLGINVKLAPSWSVHAYGDHFIFPWMKYRTYSPSKGYEYLLQINYRPQKDIEGYVRYRLKQKPVNSTSTSKIRTLDEVTRQYIRFHISYAVSGSITLKNRVEWTSVKQASNRQYGYLIYQDVAYRHLSSPWAFTARYALFDTDGYNSRIYAYENDVLYAFSFPFYAHKGQRIYLVSRYRFNRNFDLQARIARTTYTNQNQTGSGMDTTLGNRRHEIKIQARIRF